MFTLKDFFWQNLDSVQNYTLITNKFVCAGSKPIMQNAAGLQ